MFIARHRGAWVTLALVVPLCAQRQTGELRVTVVDSTGSSLAVTLDVASDVNQVSLRRGSDKDAVVVFRGLPFGPYLVQARADGFVAQQRRVQIRSEVPLELTVVMGLAPIEESVTVHDSATILNPASTASEQHIGSETLATRRSAAPARGVLQLIQTQPGWLLEANGVLHPRGSEYDTQYLVDGTPVTDNRSPAFAPALELEEIESIRVITGGFPAEYGRKLGGVVEVATARSAALGSHGVATLQGGSFGSWLGYASLRTGTERTSASLSAQGAVTDRFLDPPVQENFTNKASGGGIGGKLERAIGQHDRLQLSLYSKRNGFLVPNDSVQQQHGQRQDRASGEVLGYASYQKVFSPRWVGEFRGMGREVYSRLWTNPFGTPVIADQDRSFREGYVAASISATLSGHSLKFGSEAILTSIHERFGYQVTSDEQAQPFRFDASRDGREHSGYAQHGFRVRNVTINTGIRWDYYGLLESENFLSPRLAVGWYVPAANLLLRASYDRAVTTPAIENLLLASSGPANDVATPGVALPLRPARGHYYETGFSKSLWGKARLDGAIYRRSIRHFADDEVFFNTGISFPISFDRAEIQGYELKVDAPRWGRFSGFASYSNMVGAGRLPFTGGRLLGEDSEELLNSRAGFRISQDQRNTVQARVRIDLHARLWTAFAWWYGSGLPVEIEEEDDIEKDELIEQYGKEVVDEVNFERGRVKPSRGIDLSVGADIWKSERRALTLQADLMNITNRLNLINFTGLLSGTGIGSPRTFAIRLQTRF